MFKKKDPRKILIMGLPGSGKTFLAKEIYKNLNAIWINGDSVRKQYKDWDFSREGRIRQARRLNKLSNEYVKKGKNVVVDFICPNKDSFKNFKANFIVWVDTIKKGRHIRKHLDDINPIFRKPKKFDLRVTSQDSKLWKIVILDLLEKKKWNNKKPTAQMLGRYQPWHEGHRKLFECIVKKDLQEAIRGAKELMEEHDCADIDERAEEIIIEMVFQLGRTGVKKFRNMWKALAEHNYIGASFEMLDSKWAKQTPNRAKDMADQMKACV